MPFQLALFAGSARPIPSLRSAASAFQGLPRDNCFFLHGSVRRQIRSNEMKVIFQVKNVFD
jgi:hypothetical protein